MDQTVLKGASVTFTVIATSGTALSYQWFDKKDKKVPGGTSSILTLTGVDTKDGGTYYCAVSNGGGKVDTRDALLTVINSTTPIGVNDSYTTPEDVSLSVGSGTGVLANDLGGLTAVLKSNVTHGTLNLNTNGGFSYTPIINFNGSDTFTYTPVTGTITGNVTTVSITVTPVDDPPVIVDDATNTLEDTSVTIHVLANDYDPDGTPLTIISTSTTNGTALISGTNIVFKPSTNFNGAIIFSYTVSSGTNAAMANVAVTVIPVNDASPVASNDVYTTLEDVPLIIPVAGVLSNDTDVDRDILSAALVSNVTHGVLMLNTNGSFSYVPATNYNGTDSFTYRAGDGFSLIPVVLEENNFSGNKIELKDNETGSQSFGHGTAGYSISKIIFYVSREPMVGSGTLDVSIGTGVNSGVISGSAVSISSSSITNTSSGASFQTYEIDYATPVGPLAPGTTCFLNLDNQTGKRIQVAYPNNNSYTNGTFYYNGGDQSKDMRFQISGNSDIATVTINVIPVNDPPMANNQSVTTPASTAKLVNLTGSDADSYPLTYSIVTSPAHGVISGFNTNSGAATYVPNLGYSGQDAFSFRVNDGMTNSGTATVNITVTSVPPTASTMAASNVTAGSAMLNATVNPQGTAANYYFRYGVTTNYNMFTVTNALSADTNTVVLALPIAGLVPGTVYHYCVEADGPGGTAAGADVMFTTQSLPPIQFKGSVLPGGKNMQLALSSVSGASFEVLCSTNLALGNWTVLGTMTETSPGQYQFTDPLQITKPSCYYRIRSP